MENLLSVTEAAKRLGGISKWTIHAWLAKGKLRRKIPQLELALEGKLPEHHRFLLRLQLDRLQAVEKDLALLEQRIQEKLQAV